MRLLLLALLVGCGPKSPPEVPEAPEMSIEVRTSPLDERTYEVATFDNGLQVLAISDPDTDMAAASVALGVGHYADPADREGLAHFLEHMLFMGTEKYPDVDGYRKFVEDHGGATNAGTGGESTSYYFQVEPDSLEPAFDRFSQFFVSPLLEREYVERERNAVHSEYSLKVKDEVRRAREVRKSTTNPEHPESKFSVGNLDTLGDRGDDLVYDDLRKLYEAHYTPDNMTVAVIGRQSASTLMDMVKTRLGGLEGKRVAVPERPEPFTDEQLGVRINTVPLKERRELELQFPLPPEYEVWPFRPNSFVSGLLGSEAEGTLFAALKATGWIEWLRTGLDGAVDYDLFQVKVGLTEEGAEHVDDIVEALFAGLKLIEEEGLEPWRYEERITRANLNFSFREATTPASTVRSATWALRYLPHEHVLDGSYQWGVFDAERAKETFTLMTPERARLMVTMPGLETDQVEPHYEVGYSMAPLPPELLQRYAAAETSLEFALPPRNTFLPENTELLPGGEQPLIPVLVTDTPQVKVHHLLDTSFEVPKGSLSVEVRSGEAGDDPENMVARLLLGALINDDLQSLKYPLKQAGLRVSTSVSSKGLGLELSGYDDKLVSVLGVVLDRIAGFEPSQERFDVLRDQTVRGWKNRIKERPSYQGVWATSEAVHPSYIDSATVVTVGEKLTLDDVLAFRDRMLQRGSAHLLAHGNLSEDEAKQAGELVRTKLLADSEVLESAETQVRGIDKSVVWGLAIDHADSAVVMTMMGGESEVEAHATVALVAAVLDTPFFTQLRTEQQLGYVVSSRYTTYDVWPSLRFIIQSSSVGPVTLEERIDAFFAAQIDTLEAMPDEEFETIRAGVVNKWLEAPTQLSRRTGHLKSDWRMGRHEFAWRDRMATAVGATPKADVVAAYRAMLLEGPRLLVRNFGTAHGAELEGAEPGCEDRACVAKKLGSVRVRELQ